MKVYVVTSVVRKTGQEPTYKVEGVFESEIGCLERDVVYENWEEEDEYRNSRGDEYDA